MNENDRVKTLLRDPERTKPNFIADATPDKLVAVTLRLAMEISVLRDQLDTQRALLEKHGILSDTDFENFTPSADQVMQRKAAKEDLIAGMISDLS